MSTSSTDERLHIADIEAESGLEPLVLDVSERAAPREPRMSTSQAINYYGKRDSKFIVEQEKSKAILANRELIRRLMRDPAEFKSSELNFIAGTAVDKISKRERWERASEEGARTFTENFAAAIERIQNDETLKISLEVTRGRAAPIQVMPAIDVAVVRDDAGLISDPG